MFGGSRGSGQAAGGGRPLTRRSCARQELAARLTPCPAVSNLLQAGVVAFKLYPAGATTNSDSGVTDWKKCLPTLRAMAEVGRAVATPVAPVAAALVAAVAAAFCRAAGLPMALQQLALAFALPCLLAPPAPRTHAAHTLYGCVGVHPAAPFVSHQLSPLAECTSIRGPQQPPPPPVHPAARSSWACGACPPGGFFPAAWGAGRRGLIPHLCTLSPPTAPPWLSPPSLHTLLHTLPPRQPTHPPLLPGRHAAAGPRGGDRPRRRLFRPREGVH